jgi:hypothetical protein
MNWRVVLKLLAVAITIMTLGLGLQIGIPWWLIGLTIVLEVAVFVGLEMWLDWIELERMRVEIEQIMKGER